MKSPDNALQQTAPGHRRKVWRWFFLTFILLAFGLYISGYVRLRRHHDLIHARSYSGDGILHSIRPGESGPSLFLAAALTGQVDRLQSMAEEEERRENFHMALFAPARYAEVFFWHTVDR